MTDCLNDIQIEDVLAGRGDEQARAHVRDCADCARRLDDAGATRHRLRAAFASIHAPRDAADRIRRAIATRTADAPGEPAPAERRGRPWLIRHLGALSAAAALVIVVLLVAILQLSQPSLAQAAAAELVRLHQANLAGHSEMVALGSAEQTQAYLAGKLGFTPAVPDELGDRRIRGCCVSRFLGRRAGNFIVDGPHGPISVVVSDANARQLQTDRKISLGGRTFWVCPMQGFYTVAVQEGPLIYCAVGDDEPDRLAALLDGILSPADPGSV
jgi:hypothetical protein